MSYDQFLRFIFPEGIFDYFELSDFKEKSDRVEIYFEDLKSATPFPKCYLHKEKWTFDS